MQDPVRLYYVVTQRSVVWTRVCTDAALISASLLKLSLPHAIKTAALSGYCSAPSGGDLTGLRNLFFFFFTLKGLSLLQP